MGNLVPPQRRRSALGQGLSALIPLKTEISEYESKLVVSLPIDSLYPNPNQPRRIFSSDSLTELSKSIQEKGIIQPLIVRPKSSGLYEIIAGERRWRAAQLIGYSMIPCLIKDINEAESLELALIENIQREDLNALDTAEAYEKLIDYFSYTQETLSQKIGKDRSSITNYLRLLKLPDPVKQLLREEKISMGHAKVLLSLDDMQAQLAASQKVVTKKISVRDLEKIVQNFRSNKVSRKQTSTGSAPSSLEIALSRFFSTKVIVRGNQDDSGKLEILFHSKAELSRLLDTMGFTEDFS
jgi:ParB family chromosome partitioning protein